MSDIFSKEKRSWLMARVKGRNTAPERLVRSLLHGLGYRFRIHRKDLPGRPDIVLPRYKAVIFVHGCFWHVHTCKRASIPESNRGFWKKKLEGNARRDEDVMRKLDDIGWQHLTIWQCETRKPELVLQKLEQFLSELQERKWTHQS